MTLAQAVRQAVAETEIEDGRYFIYGTYTILIGFCK